MGDIRKMMAMARTGDPQAAAEEERTETRERVRTHRAYVRAVDNPGPDIRMPPRRANRTYVSPVERAFLLFLQLDHRSVRDIRKLMAMARAFPLQPLYHCAICIFLRRRIRQHSMRVFGYSRVSTTEQAEEGFSLDTQRQQVAGYAMIKGWQVDEHFVERGVSGSTPLADRPEGKRLLSTLGKGDVVVTAKLNRAFRSAADALTVLEELKDQGVGLHIIDLGGDVTGNGISKMVFTILAAVAEGERDRIRERIRDARRHLASQCIFGGGRRPFGSSVVMDGKIRRIVPNEAEMAVIERMKAMRREGATYRAIGAVTGHQPTSVQRILDRMEKRS
jgi:putative DNA-invertase from lambdoid prophage Rac